MYTVFDILLYTQLPKNNVDDYVNQAWNRLHYLEQELSPAGTGFVGKLNQESIITRSENTEIFDIVSNFISISKNISEKSDGSFDLTVYPLVRLWGFYVQDEKKIPSQDEIKKILKQVGMHQILITNEQIILQNNAQLDLGAIAKGYAVDEAVQILKNLGLTSGIVNAGGNVRVFGKKPDGEPWKVGIRNPSGENIQEVVTLHDGEAIATSGDYEQFFIHEGKIYHHIFDPKTGSPAVHNLASVSVIVSNSAELSDILATTLLVLGKDRVDTFLKTFDPNTSYPLFFIERDGDLLHSTFNENWKNRQIATSNK
ncbi:MAG: FAD:protein FMN transferase [Brevinema sp.]